MYIFVCSCHRVVPFLVGNIVQCKSLTLQETRLKEYSLYFVVCLGANRPSRAENLALRPKVGHAELSVSVFGTEKLTSRLNILFLLELIARSAHEASSWCSAVYSCRF